MRYTLIIIITVGIGLGEARADTSSIACGYSNGLQNNLPVGAVGLTSGDGPIKAVLSAVGELRTHSFINHGNGWTTHSTMLEPSSYGSGGTNGGDASMNLPVSPSQLQNGYPGASQINMGALYTFYYAGGTGPSGNGASGTVGSISAFYYQRGSTAADGTNRGNQVQSWLWNSSNYAYVGDDGIGGHHHGGYYRIGPSGVTPYSQYSLYQYMNQEGIASGQDTWNHGNVCSTILAYAQNKAGLGTIDNNNTYSNARVAAGVNAEWWAIYNQCMGSSAGWFDLFGVATYAYLCANGDCQTGASCCNSNGDWGCVFVGHSWCTHNRENSNKAHLCAKAANQVTNCFTSGNSGGCYDNNAPGLSLSDLNDHDKDQWEVSARWQQVAASGATSRAVSPDAIGGWNGHPYGTTAPYPVWSYDGNNQVYWNSAGNVYGCWF